MRSGMSRLILVATGIIVSQFAVLQTGICQGTADFAAAPAVADIRPEAPATKPTPPSNYTNRTLRVRIKDVVRLEGSEKYTLVGYGLVTGLNGTGDSDENLTQGTIQNLLQNFNIVVDRSKIKAQNTAAVTITATVEHSVHRGDMITATVAAIGDSTSLKGGELILSPLLGSDAEVWAIAQGPVITGGFSYGGSDEGGDQVIKNHPTVGMLTNGVKMLRDINIGPPNNDIVTIFLKEPDYTSAVNLADAINQEYLGASAAIDASTIKIRVPREYREQARVPAFISAIEQIEFHPDASAKVVFNERTGTIVIGENVKISHAAICHGNITVNIKNIEGVSQPSAFSEVGETVKIQDQQTTANEEEGTGVVVIPNTTTVGELAKVLNELGVKSRDIMIIFNVLKQAGALHAELEAM